MRDRAIALVAAWLAASLSGLTALQAADSFFQRMSPFQYMRDDNAALPASTHEQMQPATEGLNRRGIHAPIDPQLQHRQWRRTDGVLLKDHLEPRRSPTVEQLGPYLSARSIDPQKLDARFARLPQPTGTPAATVPTARPTQPYSTLARPVVHSRQVRQVLPPETLNIRLGKMYGINGAEHAVGDRSVGSGVGRVRSRR
jgi:hypothetical protein